MLLIVSKSLLGDSIDSWESGRRDWLYLDEQGRLHEGRPDVSGREFQCVLAERLLKSTHASATINRAILVTSGIHRASEQQLLRYILKLAREDYWIDVGIVTSCHAEQEAETVAELDSARTLLAADSNSRLRSIWMMGCVSSTKEAIGEDCRRGAVDYLLQMLAQGGESCAKMLGLMPDHDGERGFCRLCAWGFRSFLPSASEVEALMGREFRQSLAASNGGQSQASASVAELMKMKAEGFLKTGLQLDLAFDGQADGAATPWRDTLPILPDAPLRTWRCRLLGTGEEMSWIAKGLLRRHESVILAYYGQLVEFLRQQAKTIRLKGQDRLAHISQDARSFIFEGNQLRRLNAALRHFFPAFFLSSPVSAPTAPCPREHDPSQVDVLRSIVHGMIDKAEKRCGAELLAAKTRVWMLVGLALAALVSAGLLWLTRWDPAAFTPLIFAVLVLVVVDAINRRRFNRIKAAMNAEIEKEQANLRGQFARKVEWVLEKAGLTVQSQVVADMTALENHLRRKLDFLVATGWRAAAPVQGQVQTPDIHLPTDVAEQIRVRITDAEQSILSAGEDAAEIEWESILEKSQRQIVSLIEPQAPDATAPLDPRIEGCCTPEAPQFLARYDGVFNQRPFFKRFLLPRNIPQTWIDAILRQTNCGDQQVAIHKGDFKGASVVVLYDGLRVDQIPLCFGPARLDQSEE